MLMPDVKPEKMDHSNWGIAAAVAMLVFVVGVGVYENSGSIFGNSIQTNLLQDENSTERDEVETENESETEKETEVMGEKIEVEIVPENE